MFKVKKMTMVLAAFLLACGLTLTAQQKEEKGMTTKKMAEKTAKKPGPHDAAYEDPWEKFVKETSYVSAGGERVLRHEVVVDYPIAKCWDLFAKQDGGNTWMAPQFQLELRTGGKWWANYSATAKPEDPGWIKNTVLGYLPQEMITVKLNLVTGFPQGPIDEGTLFAVLQFKDLGKGRTLVSESLAGFGTGAEWDKVYEFFKNGNRYVFGQYVRRIKEGPIDWSKQK